MGDYSNRTGRVSKIDYEAGTYEVTFYDRDESVSDEICAISNGEYKMPNVGDMVSVLYQSDGMGQSTAIGTVWNDSNKPPEGYKGLYRKDYASKPGKAYERYDENTGEYMLKVGDAAIKIDPQGAVSIESPTKITLTAPKVNITETS